MRISDWSSDVCSSDLLGFRDVSNRRAVTVDAGAERGIAVRRPGIADDVPKIRVALGRADGERALPLQAEPRRSPVGAAKVDDDVIKRLFEMTLLNRDANDGVIGNARRIGFGK